MVAEVGEALPRTAQAVGDEDQWARGIDVFGVIDFDGDGAVALRVVQVKEEGLDCVWAGVRFIGLGDREFC